MNTLELLKEKNIINADDAIKIEKQVTSSGKTLEEVLEEKGISSDTVLDAKGEYYNIPTENLRNKDVPFSVLKYVSEDAAVHYGFVPLSFKDGVLEVGIVDPENIEARDALSFIIDKLNLPYKIFLISESDFKKVIQSYKGLSGEVTKALTELETELSSDLEDIELIKNEDTKGSVQTKIIEDAPVTKIVATILRYATEGNASDVHIEHMRDKIRVRFRVDGVLNTSLVLPAEVHQAVVARIKILSNMKLDEKRKPQDGRFSAKIEGRKIDFRVSTFPSYYGEKVVMRILDQDRGVKTLDEMGLSPRYLKMVRDAMKRPYGMILISGPTGSGKTTTLYSMLSEINKDEKNVLSLEDPIEYNIDGMSQSQVFPEIGYDFANGLRTTLRQDPDIIMVGEIRDKETAQLAVQAALTGHLVLSTIHTNNSCGVIPRLIDMGVDPYLISPTLILAMGQRLVRKLCVGTGKPMEVTESIKTMVDREFTDLPEEYKKEIPEKGQMFQIQATDKCPSGTKGRIAVFEMFKMDPDIEQVILRDPVESSVFKMARKRGLITMKEDAIIKAMQGIIPFEEIAQL
ncbi:MAG: GspE/PulE family protein [Candidatus Taylorbacteria bacterium]|nr:GspE/PulE family protein [Candidatus Taylorbacteria bacterium]